MSLNMKEAPKQESKFKPAEPLDAGTYPSRLVQIIGLGLQKQRPFKGEPKDPKQMLYLTYELLDEFLLDDDGKELTDKPRWISEDFTVNHLSSDLATSTKRYYALDPTAEHDGDFSKLAGAPCMVTLSKKPAKNNPDKIYNNVAAVTGMRDKDAQKAAPLANDPKVFDFYDPDLDVFLALPQWLQDKIKESLDYPGSDLEDLLKGAPKNEAKPGNDLKAEKEEVSDDEDW